MYRNQRYWLQRCVRLYSLCSERPPCYMERVGSMKGMSMMQNAIHFRKNACQSWEEVEEVGHLNLCFRCSDGCLGERFPAEMPVVHIFAEGIFPLQSPPRQCPV